VVEKIDKLLGRLRDKATAVKEQGGQSRMLPDRHPVRDFFIADLVDWALKDDWHSMGHPFFSLSKNPDREIRRYDHNGISISVTPSVLGLATIWDKDILIYAVSQVVEAFNQGRRDVGPCLRVTAYDLLVATNRYSGGKNYEQLAEACRRLAGTRIETDIRTNGVRQREGFGLLDGWKIIERNPSNGRMVAIELRLSEWLYNAVLACEVLTLNRDFRISPAANPWLARRNPKPVRTALAIPDFTPQWTIRAAFCRLSGNHMLQALFLSRRRCASNVVE
jgi:hypothetical protein